MRWLSLTPRVLRDDEGELVVEESHIGWGSLCAAALLLAGAFLVPAARDGSVVGLIIGLVLAGVVVVLPFLGVLAVSRYRRVEIRRGVEVVSVVVFRLWPPRSVRVPWESIARVACEWLPGTPDSPAHLRVTLHRTDGSELRLVGGWYSEDLVAKIRRHLAEKSGGAG